MSIREILHLLLLASIHCLPTRGYQLGEDVTFSFQYNLSDPDARYICSVFLHGGDKILFRNNDVPFPDTFKPGQLERFGVQYYRSRLNLTIIFTISDLQVVDEGTYIVQVDEIVSDNDKVLFHEYQAVVDVTYPPGRAQCEVDNSTTDNAWQTIRCNAALGSDGSGELVCHQILKPLPSSGDVTNQGEITKAVFYWIYLDTLVKCCTLDQHSTLSLESCDDITFYPLQENVSTKDPPSQTSSLPTKGPPGMPGGENGTGADSSPVNAWKAVFIVSLILVICVSICSGVILKYKNGTSSKSDEGHNEELREMNYV